MRFVETMVLDDDGRMIRGYLNVDALLFAEDVDVVGQDGKGFYRLTKVYFTGGLTLTLGDSIDALMRDVAKIEAEAVDSSTVMSRAFEDAWDPTAKPEPMRC